MGSQTGLQFAGDDIYLYNGSGLLVAHYIGATRKLCVDNGTTLALLSGAVVTMADASVDMETDSASVAYPKTSAGTLTLIAASTASRTVIVVATVTEVFADAGATQPTFSIGETGTVAKYAATSIFTDAASGSRFVFAGTLTANAALIVTAAAATGAATGALTITALVLPA